MTTKCNRLSNRAESKQVFIYFLFSFGRAGVHVIGVGGVGGPAKIMVGENLKWVVNDKDLHMKQQQEVALLAAVNYEKVANLLLQTTHFLFVFLFSR